MACNRAIAQLPARAEDQHFDAVKIAKMPNPSAPLSAPSLAPNAGCDIGNGIRRRLKHYCERTRGKHSQPKAPRGMKHHYEAAISPARAAAGKA